MRISLPLLVVFLVSLAPVALAQVKGTVADFDASDNPAANPAQDWDANVGGLSWVLDGGGAGQTPVLTSGINDGKTTITDAYTFDGDDTATMAASWPNSNVSSTFELWIRPTDLSGDEVVFEVGGTTDGSSLRLEDSMLIWRSLDSGNAAEASADISGVFDADEFLQVAVEIDLQNEVRLFVDGQQVASGPNGSFNDFAGTDNNALGSIAGQFGGAPSGSFNPFIGDIAILRFSDSLLGATAIEDNFNSLLAVAVPEPASIAIWTIIGVGLLGFGYRQWRR